MSETPIGDAVQAEVFSGGDDGQALAPGEGRWVNEDAGGPLPDVQDDDSDDDDSDDDDLEDDIPADAPPADPQDPDGTGDPEDA